MWMKILYSFFEKFYIFFQRSYCNVWSLLFNHNYMYSLPFPFGPPPWMRFSAYKGTPVVGSRSPDPLHQSAPQRPRCPCQWSSRSRGHAGPRPRNCCPLIVGLPGTEPPSASYTASYSMPTDQSEQTSTTATNQKKTLINNDQSKQTSATSGQLKEALWNHGKQ